MQSYDAREEREIDLIDIIWRFCMQWKPVLLVMLLCGLITTGIKYVKDVHDYNALEATQKQSTEEELMSQLTETEYNAVIAAYNSQVQRDSVRKYVDESLLLQANPYDQRTLTINYRVDTADETSYSVTEMYSTLLGSDAFASLLAKTIDYDGDIKYVRELYTVSVPGIESSSLMFSFSMTLLTDMDAEKIADMTDNYIRQTAYQQISESKPFTITKMAQSVRDIMLTGDTTSRMDYEKRITNMDAAIKTTTDAFTDVQKALYAKLVESDEQTAEESAFKAEEDEGLLAAPSLSWKFLLLGLFGGAVVYGGCMMMLAVFSPKTQTATDMCDIYGLYVIDELHRRRFAGAWQKFLYDKNIYRLRNLKKNKDENKSITEATTQIAGLKEHTKRSRIFLAPLGKGFANGPAASYYDGLKKALSDVGIAAEELHEDRIKDEILNIPPDAGIVVLTNVGDTTYRALDDVYMYANKYGIELLGVIALEMN